MSLLRIQLDADLDLAALDADAALLAQPFAYASVGRGQGGLRATAPLGDMPTSVALELLLPAAAVRIVRVKLPRVTGQALRRVLPNVVEDSVVGDIADCHLVPLPGLAPDGLRDVAIVDRAWMRLAQRIVQLRRARSICVISEAMLAPHLPFLWVQGPHGYLRHIKGVLPFVVPEGTEVPAELRLARSLLGSGPVETGGLGPELAAHWARALEVQLAGSSWTWVDAPPVDPSWSLLQFEYARGVQTGESPLRVWRWPLLLAGACLAVAVIGLNLTWWKLVRERNELQARIDADAKTAFPNLNLSIDPLGQARRQVALATGGHEEGYFRLSTALAEGLDAPAGPTALVRSLEYRAGSLRAKLAPGVNAAKVADHARAAELEVSTEPTAADGTTVIVLRKKAS
jgi:general secretion pathway protein L